MVIAITETGVSEEIQVTNGELVAKAKEMKNKGARYITVTARDLGDTLEVIHHFEVQDSVENIYTKVRKGEKVHSITSVYPVAFIAENEARDFFGIEFEGLNLDLGGKMLKTATSPSTLLKPAVGPQPPIMRKLGPCREECPAMVNIPKYIRQVESGDPEGAYNTIIEQAPIPGILGRVCFAPCQQGCRQELEIKPIQIRALKRYAADEFWKLNGGTYVRDVERKPSTGKHVAVIGGGPAGVSAAYYLGMLGHKVTLFEKEESIGGAMLWGIPKYRLPKDTMEEELMARLIEAGVKVKTKTPVDDLLALMDKGYDAAFIAIGSEKSNSMRCEGEDNVGVINFVEFLTAVNVRNETPELGDSVAVIGGGNSAMDAARTAKRLGADEVTVYYRRTEEEMPASLHEIHGAMMEGINFDFLSTQMRIKAGKPLRIEFQCMIPGEPDKSGRRRPLPMDGRMMSIEADTIISAIGYHSMVPESYGVEVNRWGNIEIDENYRTSLEGVYAGGDVAFGPTSVIAAIRDAREAASAIDKYLGGEGLPEPLPDTKEFVPRQTNLDELKELPQVEIPELDPIERVKSFVEFEQTLEKCQAKCEAGRCWRCDWNE